jgi:large subunit ribosomal protein L24
MKNKMKVKKGDTVIVIAGKDKGKRGEVLRSIPADWRVVVQGVNVVKRHTRPAAGQPGGIVEKEASIHVSNVMLVDPKTDKPTRVGRKLLDDGRKVRYAKGSGEVIDR